MKTKITASFLLTCSLLFAETSSIPLDVDIENMLNDIEKKTDLSEETKLQNSGISFIFTRDEINRIQAKTLKDILKTVSGFDYDENRYGLPDPLSQGTSTPFMSSSMRVFIDNQEVEAGMYGSGLIIYGDINIGFVDHIEIYTQSPTYEYSTEPTYMLVKLYSKSVKKDEGSQIEIDSGSFGYTRLSGYSSGYVNDWSYFSYFSSADEKRQRYTYKDTELSRDRKLAHLFTSITKKNHHIIINGMVSDRDGFIAYSPDASASKNEFTSKNLHIGYDGKVNDLSFGVTYDYLNIVYDYEDDNLTNPQFVQMRHGDSDSHTISGEVKYKTHFENDFLITGIKYRSKRYYYNKHIINNFNLPNKKNKQQNIATFFIENQYIPSVNTIFSSGVEYINVKNKDAIYNKKDDLFLLRMSYTYLLTNWKFKSLFTHTEFYLQPYLIDSYYLVAKDFDSEMFTALNQEFIYKYQNTSLDIIFGLLKTKDYLFPDENQDGKLNQYNKILLSKTAILRIVHEYNTYDKFFVEFSYLDVNNLEQIIHQSYYKNVKAIFRNINTYKKFDYYNELIFGRNNLDDENRYNLSTGLIYHHSKDLTLSFKAENILNKATQTSYPIINPETLKEENPLKISPFDKRIILSMEYRF